VSSTATLVKLGFRGLRAHATRLLLTLLTVVLGTGFVAGTLILTNSLDHTFESVASSEYEGVDIAVIPGEGQRTVPEEARDQLESNPLVDRVNVRDQRSVVLTEEGSTIDTGGLPVRPVPWYDDQSLVGPPKDLQDGTDPGPGQIAVSVDTAKEHGLHPGSSLTVNDQDGKFPVTVSGIFGEDSSDNTIDLVFNDGDYTERYASSGLQGLVATVAAGEDPPTVAQQLSDDIEPTSEPISGTTTQENSSQETAPEVHTGTDLAESDAQTVSAGLGFVSYFLVAFGLIALLVGMFIIANTFALTVAQRMQDFSLLRALGASRSQVTGSVLVEAVIIGLVGSTLGVGAGSLLVRGILAVLDRVDDRMDLGLPGIDVHVTTSGVVIPLVLGLVVTIVSAWAPARRAGSAAPLTALHQSSDRVPRLRTALGLVVFSAGIASAAVAALTDDWSTSVRATLSGLGAAAVLIGFFLFSPAVCARVLPPFGRVIGAPFRTAGRLSASAARRNPRRTAGTAFALLLGLSLVTLTGMLGSSMTASVNETVDSEVTADLVVGPPGGSLDVAVPGRAVGAIEDADGVGSTYTVGKALAVVGEPRGQSPDSPAPSPTLITVSGGDPSGAFDLGATEGELDLGAADGGVTMSSSYADEHGYSVGDLVPVGVPGQARPAELPLQGIYGQSRLLGDVVIDSGSFWELAPGDQGGGGHRILAVAVSSDGTHDVETLRGNLEDAVADVPVVQVQTPEEFAGGQTVLIDRLVAVVYALLALAVAVAVLGVVNTLALTVVERRREIGVLRAVGMGRGQISGMILLESLQTALYGAVTGIAVGLFAGWSFLSVLSDVGISSIAVPWGPLALVLVGSVIVGAIAAVAPGIRAARTPPLDAVAE
jgi:putative ABC transport system permease protein